MDRLSASRNRRAAPAAGSCLRAMQKAIPHQKAGCSATVLQPRLRVQEPHRSAAEAAMRIMQRRDRIFRSTVFRAEDVPSLPNGPAVDETYPGACVPNLRKALPPVQKGIRGTDLLFADVQRQSVATAPKAVRKLPDVFPAGARRSPVLLQPLLCSGSIPRNPRGQRIPVRGGGVS